MDANGHGESHLRYRWSSEREGDRFQVDNPATGTTLGVIQGGGAEEVDGAVRAADAAYRGFWRFTPPQERGKLLVACGQTLKQHMQELAELESAENGKPVFQAMFDIDSCANSFSYFGGLAGNLPTEFIDFGPIHCSVFLEPYGVVGGVLPFNWPPVHTGAKAAPALAVGNTVVLKPGEQAPLTVMRIVELLQTILPPDVLHAVPGLAPAGDALVSHPLVRKLSFTGATETGIRVLKQAADNVTPAMLELGGKNALLVYADANLDDAVHGAIDGAFFNQGEACTAASRILVHHSVHDEFVAKMKDVIERIRVGSGAELTTHMGPMVTRAQQQRVLGYIEAGKADGALVAAQGKLPEDPSLEGGFWVAPTLFTNVSPEMSIARDEVFGPVTCVIPFGSEAEAVELANDTEYGLVAGVYTRDHALAMRTARMLDVGIVYVNNYFRGGIGGPFGGAKASGFGREHAIETLREYGRSKAVRTPSGIGEVPQWRVE